jgi:phospholipid/cholesterol/gamma-HCH transport system ATP-binding protein
MSEAIIQVRGLCNRFGSHTVHQDLNLDVQRGEVLGLVGGSGTGKSVLLRSLLGLQRQSAGEIVFDGAVVDGDGLSDPARARRMSMLFQDGALFSSLTVAENITMPLREHFHLPGWLRQRLVEQKLYMVGLRQDAASLHPSELSGGMRKRAALARALVTDPSVLFLDEPTAGLDPIGANAFDTLVRRLQRSLGLTVVMVTHDLDSLFAVCDRVAVLADKQVVVVDRPEALLQHTHPWIREYFNGPRGRAARHN